MKKEVVEEKIITQAEDVAKHASGFFRSRYGLWALALISMVESAILLPIITDPFLVAYILSNKKRAAIGVLATTLASVVGGVGAYFMAMGFFDYFAGAFLQGTVLEEFNRTVAGLDEGTFLLTIIGAITPVPYTLVALAAGFVKANLLVFVIGTFVGRGFRYALVGYLTYRFGERALELARKQVTLASICVLILAVLYILYKF